MIFFTVVYYNHKLSYFVIQVSHLRRFPDLQKDLGRLNSDITAANLKLDQVDIVDEDGGEFHLSHILFTKLAKQNLNCYSESSAHYLTKLKDIVGLHLPHI